MRKTRTISFRVAAELYQPIDEMENKTEYLTRLLVDDLDKGDEGIYGRELAKQKHLLNVRVMGRVGNAAGKYKSLAKSCTTRKQREILHGEILKAMRLELKAAQGEDVAEFIRQHIEDFEAMDL